MNRRQKKKKNTKYEYLWGYSYKETRIYDRKIHERHIKYIQRMKGIVKNEQTKVLFT